MSGRCPVGPSRDDVRPLLYRGLFYGSPCLAAGATFGIYLATMRYSPGSLSPDLLFAVVAINGILAAAGSGAAGLLRLWSAGERIVLTIVMAACGLGYYAGLIAAALAAVHYVRVW